jgi:hypothetical protein
MSEERDTNLIELQLQDTLRALEPTKKQRVLRKLIMAALGSIPWVGGFLTTAQAYMEDEGQFKTDALQRQWLEEHREKMKRLAHDLAEIVARLNNLGDEIQERLESESYLALVRKAFRLWDTADTEHKREYIKKLIANAGASTLCNDDLVRLFLDWLNTYHEAHFLVIKQIYNNDGITRHAIWHAIHGEAVREDSSDADLFKLLVDDLSIGHVIRQHREKTYDGEFLKKPRTNTGVRSSTMKSAFDDQAGYELTELGKKFVHYVFSDVITRIEQ